MTARKKKLSLREIELRRSVQESMMQFGLSKSFEVFATADYAMWTPPFAGPDRVSMPVGSHEAIRGCLRSILGKREIEWTIQEVKFHFRPRWITINRNEVRLFPPGLTPINVRNYRTQRLSHVLCGPRYTFRVTMGLSEKCDSKNLSEAKVEMAKYSPMFPRRVRQGGGYRSSYFGCREYASGYEMVEDLDSIPEVVPFDQDLGISYFGTDYNKGLAYFAPLCIHGGILKFPTWDEVRKIGITRNDNRSTR